MSNKMDRKKLGRPKIDDQKRVVISSYIKAETFKKIILSAKENCKTISQEISRILEESFLNKNQA